MKLGRLVEEEKVEVGSIPTSIYHLYIKYAGGYLIAMIALVFFIVNVGSAGKKLTDGLKKVVFKIG